MEILNLFSSDWTWVVSLFVFFFATTWTPKVDGVDTYLAAHINLLQTDKADKDGGTALTGTVQEDKGADVASANPLVPGADGNFFHVTGTTNFSAINAAQSQPGTQITLVFDGILTITHHAVNLILPGGSNITTAAGDRSIWREEAADKWRCISYVRADGSPGLHASTHESGGTDDIKLDDLATPDDNADLDSTITEHGLLPKLSNVANQFINGKGAWAVPVSGGGGIVLEGTIVAYNPGYYTNGSNAGYTFVLGAGNTVAQVNAVINGSGWYVCNGAALNEPLSTIFNGANRYLPNLTDDRFLMGDTTCGTPGGSSTMVHTHNEGTLTIANESAHTHASGTFATENHDHDDGTLTVASHLHTVDPPNTTSGAPSVTSARSTGGLGVATDVHTHDVDISSFNSGNTSPDVAGVTGSTIADITGTSAAGSAHGHGISGNSGAASNDENRPKYLAVFYIMYVLA